MAETTTSEYVTERRTSGGTWGTTYNVLGILLVIGIGAAFIAALVGARSPGWLSDSTAFFVGGLALTLGIAVLAVLLFTLSSHIRQVQSHLAFLTRVRQDIEQHYGRLEEATGTLAGEIQELRRLLPNARQVAALPKRDVKQAAADLKKELQALRSVLAEAQQKVRAAPTPAPGTPRLAPSSA